MAIGLAIERMDDRLDAIEASLILALATHVISRSLKSYLEQSEADISKGIITIVSAGESSYNAGLGMVAREGIQRILLIGHLHVAEGTAGKDIEAAELDLLEEIKAWVRQPITGMSLRLDNVQHSQQLDHPYGWLVAYIDIGPPRATTH